MRLREKLKALRELEGVGRGFPRGLPKAEMAKLIRKELGEPISLAYLSQLEAGTRTHMTNKTRLLLARFFRIHPEYLVDDPEEFQRHIGTPIAARTDSLADWLQVGAARFRHDPLIAETLERLARYPERRKALRLFRELLAMPALLDRLLHTLDAKTR